MFIFVCHCQIEIFEIIVTEKDCLAKKVLKREGGWKEMPRKGIALRRQADRNNDSISAGNQHDARQLNPLPRDVRCSKELGLAQRKYYASIFST